MGDGLLVLAVSAAAVWLAVACISVTWPRSTR